MFCRNCGTEIPDGSDFCGSCGAAQNTQQQTVQIQGTQQPYMGGATPTFIKRNVPMCTCCGYVGQWKEEPLLLARHWVIAGLTLILGGFGIFYLITVMIIRSGKSSRAKICQHCGARNLFTFMY